MLKYTLYLLLVLPMLALSACGEETEEAVEGDALSMKLDEPGVEFLVWALSANRMEIEMAGRALERTHVPEVRNYSQMLIQDHRRTQEELLAVARELNVERPDQFAEQHLTWLTELKEYPAEDFDEEFVRLQEDIHEDVVGRYEKAAKNLQNTELRMLAKEMLPTLRMHREAANRLENQLRR